MCATECISAQHRVNEKSQRFVLRPMQRQLWRSYSNSAPCSSIGISNVSKFDPTSMFNVQLLVTVPCDLIFNGTAPQRRNSSFSDLILPFIIQHTPKQTSPHQVNPTTKETNHGGAEADAPARALCTLRRRDPVAPSALADPGRHAHDHARLLRNPYRNTESDADRDANETFRPRRPSLSHAVLPRAKVRREAGASANEATTNT